MRRQRYLTTSASGLPRAPWTPGLVVFCLISVSLVCAQNKTASQVFEGLITDSTGAAIASAHVKVRNLDSSLETSATTDKSGRFSLEGLQSGQYKLRVEAAGFQIAETVVAIFTKNLKPVTIVLPLSSVHESVTVEGSRVDIEASARAHTEIGSALTDSLPNTAVNGGFSNALTLGTPGVAADSNGSFHPLGEHAEVSFNVDGQPISDQQSRTFSNQVSLNTVESVDVITGAPPAEFGDKTSMTVRAVTWSGLKAGKPKGAVSLGYGSFGTGTGGFSLLTGDSRFGNFFTADSTRSGRFLDTPEFVPLHATGNAENLFDRFDVQPTPADSFHLNLSYGRSWFQTPNTYLQETDLQNQRQLMQNENVAAAYSHFFGPSRLLNANAWWRQDHVDYYPSRSVFSDQPATFSQDRSLVNFGARIDLSFTKKHHNVKTGFQAQWTPLNEFFTTGLTDPAFNSPCLDSQGVPVPNPDIRAPADCAIRGDLSNPAFQASLLQYDLTRGGTLFQFRGAATIREQSAYVQDTMNFGRLGINLGIRGDRYDGISHGSALQPRTGLSYQLPLPRDRGAGLLRPRDGHAVQRESRAIEFHRSRRPRGRRAGQRHRRTAGAWPPQSVQRRLRPGNRQAHHTRWRIFLEVHEWRVRLQCDSQHAAQFPNPVRAFEDRWCDGQGHACAGTRIFGLHHPRSHPLPSLQPRGGRD